MMEAPPERLPAVPDIVRSPFVRGALDPRADEHLARYNPISGLARMLAQLRRAMRGIWYQGARVGEEPDYSTRTEALKIALAWHGVIRNGGESAPTVAVQFNVAALDSAKLLAVADRLDRLTARMSAAPASRASAIPSFMALTLAPHDPATDGPASAPGATPDPARAASPPPAANIPQ